jgi:hypothetical protein
MKFAEFGVWNEFIPQSAINIPHWSSKIGCLGAVANGAIEAWARLGVAGMIVWEDGRETGESRSKETALVESSWGADL